jgi:hypothetical protein
MPGHHAHVTAKLGISSLDGDIISLKMVHEAMGSVAAYCQWSLSNKVRISFHLFIYFLPSNGLKCHWEGLQVRGVEYIYLSMVFFSK